MARLIEKRKEVILEFQFRKIEAEVCNTFVTQPIITFRRKRREI